MKLIDLYYKAFKSLRNITVDNHESHKLRQTIAYANHKDEVFEALRYDCNIELEWIENIEEGLVFVEKAIREDRQFIRTEGDVIPIEKVKRVSKSSVRHLAKHSNLITRKPEDETKDIIPDKLYMEEKLNDYLVYENRFLFLLLSYLKDFLQFRVDQIKDKTTTYSSLLILDKNVEANQHHLKYQLNVDEKYKNDPLLMDRYHHIKYVDRMENVFAITVSLLSSPLMKEVSKAPLLKLPIIKTNVLRMNQNFKAALKLFDYITSFNRDGYEFVEVKKTLKPLPKEMSDEIAEIIQLGSFITYMEGNELRTSLEDKYRDQLEIETEINSKNAQEEIKRLKKRMLEFNEDPEAYILKLEKRNNELEKEKEVLYKLRQKNEDLINTINQLELDKHKYDEKIQALGLDLLNKVDEIDQLNQKYYDDMVEAEEVHQTDMDILEQKYLQIIEQLKLSHQNELKQLKDTHELFVSELREKHENEKEKIFNAHEKEITEYRDQLFELNQTISNLNENIANQKASYELTIKEKNVNIKDLNQRLNIALEEKQYASAQYMALKVQQGLLDEQEDFTTKDKFAQLELEMKAYKKLFKEEWKKAKTKIRDKVRKEMFEEDNKEQQKKNN